VSADWPAEPFWTFSLEVYARNGVEAACLELQERHQLDVNLLLLCCWLGTRGIRLGEAEVAGVRQQVGDWRARVILPLRTVRRHLKDLGTSPSRSIAPLVDQVRSLRRRLQAAELDAERVEQAVLAGAVRERAADGEAGPGLATSNLALVHHFEPADRPALEQLLRGAFPAASPDSLEAALRSLAGAPARVPHRPPSA
jgi:uncharacterized protein (TIGR02444 family)